jgi:hypothetical protein
MPRGKKLRFSPTKPKPRRAPLPPPVSNGLPPALVVQSEGTAPLVVDNPELPKMCCVVCYKEFTPYKLGCTPWESAVTQDFYVSLDIPHDNDSVVALPFCPECHSKVTVMFSLHQQVQSIMQNFNSVRNGLAFNVVETINKNCRKGPLDLIRKQIVERKLDNYC